MRGKLAVPGPLPAEGARPQISRDMPGGTSAPTSCPMRPGKPAYDEASVIKVTFPWQTGYDKAPWTIRQDHPGGKAPCNRNPPRNLTR